jgi:hypothetical protein
MKFHTWPKLFMSSGSRCGYGLINKLNKPMNTKKKLKILRKIPWSIKIHTNPPASDMSKPFGFQQPLEVPNLFNISLDQIPIIMK